MIIKNREPSKELKKLRALKPRIGFTRETESYHEYLEKGFEGELTFDMRSKPISEKMLFLNDLSLKQNNSECQIDSVALAANKLHMFEIKNFEGDYSVKGDKWYSPSNKLVKNPLQQLERSDTLLNQLLNEKGFPHTVESHLIFIHPEFHLFNIPSHLPIIYFSQLNRFIKKKSELPLKITQTDNRLAETLLALHSDEDPQGNNNLPLYDYETLKKGIFCPKCQRVYGPPEYTSFYCIACKIKEGTKEAVLRSVEEFRLLFPERKITTQQIFEWCGVFKDQRRIRKILKENFKREGENSGTYFR
ncbi:nuclease-related domain-containing protein [Rossellomorea vietnamensis]|uniref:nuclease-related domain-containing protein n=1 Tax=Rossellomorea vietnamensis TaxID=218284 RepID=UPI003CF3B0F9